MITPTLRPDPLRPPALRPAGSSPRSHRIALAFALLLASAGCTRVVGVQPGATLPGPDASSPPAARPAEPPPRAADPGRDLRDPRPVGGDPSPFGPQGVRGVWVVRTSMTSPERVRRIVDDAQAAGVNTLIVQVRGRADAFYRSAIEPRAPQLSGQPASFDPLAELIRLARPRGMQVHAWLVTHLVWGMGPTLPEDPTHLVRAHPEWLAVPRELARELDPIDPRDPRYLQRLHQWTLQQEGRLEGMYTNPAHPGVQDRFLAVVDDLLTHYQLDGIHLDYVRYAAPNFDYSRGARDEFREWMGSRVPIGEQGRLDALARSGEVLAWVERYPEEWDRFRESRIDELVARVADRVRRAPSRPLLTAAVFADPIDAREGRFQNWQPWIRQGRIDVVIPMAYTPDVTRWSDLMRAGLEADPTGERVWMGIGIWQDSFDGALTKARMARTSRIGGLILFSYDWAAFEAPAVQGREWLDAWWGAVGR